MTISIYLLNFTQETLRIYDNQQQNHKFLFSEELFHQFPGILSLLFLASHASSHAEKKYLLFY